MPIVNENKFTIIISVFFLNLNFMYELIYVVILT